MSALLAITRREIGERRLYLVGGLLLGLVPLAAPLLPIAPDQPVIEVREAMAVTLFWLAGLVFSVLLGAAVFGRDLAERRLGFYFSRPLGGWTIFVGKLGGALAVALGATTLVLLPTLLWGRRMPAFFFLWNPGDRSLPLGAVAGVWLLSLGVLVLAAHYLRSLALARSPWRLLDVVGVVFALVAVRWIAAGLLDGQAWGALGRALTILGSGLLVALVVAAAAQILRGRAAVRLGYRLLSTVFWGLTSVALAAAAGYAGWVLSAGPADLERPAVTVPAPTGEWVLLSGRARGRADYRASFLYRVSDGAHLRMPVLALRMFAPMGSPWPLFSADGSRSCWLRALAPRTSSFRIVELRPFGLPSEVWCADLDAPTPRARVAPIVLPASSDRQRPLALSPDGSRLAQLANRLLTVEEIETGRLLASRRLAVDASRSELFFSASGDSLFAAALECGTSCRIEVWKLDIATAKLDRLFEREGGWAWARDPLGDRLLLMEEAFGRILNLWLADLRTASVESVTPPSSAPVWAGRFLADGRLLLQSGLAGVAWGRDLRRSVVGWEAHGGELWLAARDGSPLRRLGRREGHLMLGGQPAPNRLLVIRSKSWLGGDRRHADTYLIDLASGEERLVGKNLMPVAGPETGLASTASRLLQDEDGDLLLLDPETLDLSPVLATG